MIYNDKPIEKEEEDKLGRNGFVDALAKVITSYESSDNLVIGLNGRWGSGKTSVMNLLEKNIKNRDDGCKYIFLKFNPWNFKEQDELIQSFFKEIYSQLNIIDWSAVIKATNATLGFLENIKNANISALASDLKKYAGLIKSTNFGESLEKRKSKINKRLDKFKGKLIIYIDDIDRLNNKEINQIFQLVKLLANFNNVIYILSYDHDVIVSALEDSQRNHAEEYLEKIIQIPITLPIPASTRLAFVIEEKIKKIVGDSNLIGTEMQWQKLENTGFFNQFNSIREINRFINVFQLKYVPLRKEIDALDFAIITLFEIKYKNVYKFIYLNKFEICGLFRENLDNNVYHDFKNKINEVVEEYNNIDKLFIINALRYLFPKYDRSLNDSPWYNTPNRQYAIMLGRIFVEEKFDFYFSLSEEDLIFTNTYMNELLYKHTRDEFMNSLKDINNKNLLGEFIIELSDRCNFIPISRFDAIIDWLCSVDDNKIENELVKWSDQIAKMVIEFYSHQKGLLTKLKKVISSGNISYLEIKIMIRLESAHGRFYDKILVENIVPLQELLELENLIKTKLEKQFEEKSILESKWFKEKFYFMCHIDDKYMVDWCTKIEIYDDMILSLISKLSNCRYSQIYGTKEWIKVFSYEIRLLRNFMDLRKCHDIVYNKIKKWQGNKDEEFYSFLAFLRNYEYGLESPFVLTEQQLDEYYNKISSNFT